MNKKLIKTLASVVCGLGVITSIPFVSTSCGKTSSDTEPTTPYLSLSDGIDAEICGIGDYVDFTILDEPVSPITGDKSKNGHTCDKFTPQFIDTSSVYDPTAFREYFDNHFWPEVEGEYTGEGKVTYENPFPTYGFYYDKANDLWHFMFKVKKDIDMNFYINFSVVIGVPLNEDGSEKNMINTNKQRLTFYNSAPKPVLVPGQISELTLNFSTKQTATPSTFAKGLSAELPSDTGLVAPANKTIRGWADWFSQDVINSSNDKVNKYRSNIYAYLCAMEQYCFFQELANPSKYQLNLEDFKIVRINDSSYYYQYFTTDEDGKEAHLTDKIVDNLFGTIHFFDLKNNDTHSTTQYKKMDCIYDSTISIHSAVKADSTFRYDTKLPYGVVYNPSRPDYDDSSLKNNKWMISAQTQSLTTGAYLRNMGGSSGGDNNLFIIDIEGVDSDIYNGGSFKIQDNTFNYITHYCKDPDSIKALLEPILINTGITVSFTN